MPALLRPSWGAQALSEPDAAACRGRCWCLGPATWWRRRRTAARRAGCTLGSPGAATAPRQVGAPSCSQTSLLPNINDHAVHTYTYQLALSP